MVVVAPWHNSCATNRLIHILITSPATSGVFYCLSAPVSKITALLDGGHNSSH
ncbi:hypothetical protein SynBIOSU31_02211 [Synechococcus sp. BIOS-U3-1]|nr:hypothetical protein SynBIOSU31_02211 [Synechococcus sp. BIOS-U3-1]